jgi:two-component system, OmpR family, sensor histidine kinase PhoQ
MTKTSLRRRFFTNTTVVAITVMIVSMLVVDFIFKEELEKTAHENLRLHIFTLLSVAQTDRGMLRIPAISYNPRLNTDSSGLWALVLDAERKIAWRSLSIDTVPDNIRLGLSAGDWIFDKLLIDGHRYLTVSYKIVWEDNGQRYIYHFVAGEDEDSVKAQVQHFRLWLLGGFFSVTAVLLLCQFIVLRLAFRPISLLENEILSLEKGEKKMLSLDYPSELGGVAKNLNLFIDKERSQRERYRASMADLAHSLKTPMTIINTELTAYSNNKILKDAIVRINKIIEYQLRRAVVSGHSLVGVGTDVSHVLNLVVEALQKIYREKSINIELHVDEGLIFPGDENDLTEILGNVLDNAYKYAREKISVTVTKYKDSLVITVEDDGDGLSAIDASIIFDRGERLDCQGLGQGIGLAVVFDIVNSYQGNIDTGSSCLGGALFKIVFPFNTTS